jgi:hypothetical protein
MENRIKEQLELFGDRMSSQCFDSNQLRLSLSSMAYLFFVRLREALSDSELSRAQPDTIRLKLLKIGVLIKKSTRRFLFSFASGYPYKDIFVNCFRQIIRARPG